MSSERIFQIALLVSVTTHGVILFYNPNLSFFNKNNKKEEKLEISYVKKQELKEKNQKETTLKKDLPIMNKKVIPPPFIDEQEYASLKKEALKTNRQLLSKPVLHKPDIIAIKKKITLPPIDINKIDNPSYISYYQIVREKIRRAAYQTYTGNEIGEIYITFVIASNGNVKDVRLIRDKSSRSKYLQDITLQSVDNAAPFPAFPKELDYPQLSFNVVISFEIE